MLDYYRPPWSNVPIADLICLTCLWQSMAKNILKEVAKVVIVVAASRLLVVMVTIQRSFLAVTNAVAMVNDCWPAVT